MGSGPDAGHVVVNEGELFVIDCLVQKELLKQLHQVVVLEDDVNVFLLELRGLGPDVAVEEALQARAEPGPLLRGHGALPFSAGICPRKVVRALDFSTSISWKCLCRQSSLRLACECAQIAACTFL